MVNECSNSSFQWWYIYFFPNTIFQILFQYQFLCVTNLSKSLCAIRGRLSQVFLLLLTACMIVTALVHDVRGELNVTIKQKRNINYCETTQLRCHESGKKVNKARQWAWVEWEAWEGLGWNEDIWRWRGLTTVTRNTNTDHRSQQSQPTSRSHVDHIIHLVFVFMPRSQSRYFPAD